MSLNSIRALVLSALFGFAVAPAFAAGPSVGGPFALTTQDGTRFTEADLKGRPHLVFFGFTSCPDVCPTTLYELWSAFAEIGAPAEALRVVLVTVDPERDTPERLRDYLSPFDRRFLALHGTPVETAEAARAFRATYARIPLGENDYTMDHTALVYMMDRHGRFADRLDTRAPREEQVARLKALLASE